MSATRVLVTGGAGFLGRQVVAKLAQHPQVELTVSVDIREGEVSAIHENLDIRDPRLRDLVKDHQINRVVHLAAVVSPGPSDTREMLYSIDVDGTRNVVEACLAAGVEHLTVTSSGAAYGYHPDLPDWIDEAQPLRGNPEFAYSDHKRIVEEILATYRRESPQLQQLVLRPGTILGASVDNQITRLFERPAVLGVSGSATPFVFIWDDDVVHIVTVGTVEKRTGIYNLAGSGAIELREIAKILGKKYLPIPAPVLKGALAILRRFRLVPYGPEQLDFLRYRPVLSNRRLISEFGYTPRTSGQAFAEFCQRYE